jgi:hypothetical protein
MPTLNKTIRIKAASTEGAKGAKGSNSADRSNLYSLLHEQLAVEPAVNTRPSRNFVSQIQISLGVHLARCGRLMLTNDELVNG